MNRLNKIILSFVLPAFCLLISVSSAFVFEENYNYSSYSASHNTTYPNSVGGYTTSSITTILNNYLFDTVSYEEQFNSFINATGYTDYLFLNLDKSSNRGFLLVFNSNEIDVAYDEYNQYIVLGYDSGVTFYTFPYGSVGYINYFTTTGIGKYEFTFKNIYHPTCSIKQMSNYIWDGTSYYYEPPLPEEPDTPSLPSNAEIAQAVQAFYNSDYYKNNKDFSDFMVLYNYDTKYFDFIGHNFGNKLGQQIIDADVEIGSPPISYSERWWRYFITGLSEFTSTLFNKYYWLYSTNDLGENVNYEGKGSINDLLDLHFSTRSIIVYSTTDYPVNTLLKNDNGEIESTVDTIPGDQYTYDETLDPTTNEYNPLENFVPTSPSQTILGDVDFDEINKTFEENKDILNIENASWLFTANNQLTNYFIGFLSLLIVFLIISRILGG